LASGASWSDRNGQASVTVRVRNDTIFVDAACDSLQRQVESYEMELNRARNAVETRLKIEEKNSVQSLFKWCAIGFLAGVIFSGVIFAVWRK
jgi:hypothetical protein